MRVVYDSCWDTLYEEVKERKNNDTVIGMFTRCGHLLLSIGFENPEKATLYYKITVNNDYSEYTVMNRSEVLVERFDSRKKLVDWIEKIGRAGIAL